MSHSKVNSQRSLMKKELQSILTGIQDLSVKMNKLEIKLDNIKEDCKKQLDLLNEIIKKESLRKPIVEKIRRNRINSSIQQLKELLEKEFKRKEPSSKLQIADIMEMTVNVLRKHNQSQEKAAGSLENSSHQHFRNGYGRCLQKTLAFLSLHDPNTEVKTLLLNHFLQIQAVDADVHSASVPPASPSGQHLHQQDIISPPQSPLCQHLLTKDTLNSTRMLWRPW
ncbi:transcription factor HES-5-like [Protopterus annectens]|uniref:transcription factor HES-5-like n=1 Tax=Protopterus annectens TaxID=7888 RepID=UPI001CFB6B0A|nr:transcription factor HES-5-like [Protopterus annectens]